MALQSPLSQVDKASDTMLLEPKIFHDDSDTEHTAGRPSQSEVHCPDITAEETSRLIYRVRRTDILLLLGIFIMLCWPWALFLIILTQKGIPLGAHFANLVQENLQTTDFFVTQIGTVVNYIITFFFSTAVLRFAQRWMAHKPSITNFHLSLILAFRDQNLPWGMKDRRYLRARKRWIRVVLVAVCILAFSNVPSGVTTLISPIRFDRKAPLIGNELDFASTDPVCLDWFTANLMSDSCQWKTFKGLNFSTCREDIMLDVLGSGRASVLDLLPTNSETTTFSQIGAKDGLTFDGSFRGVLPIGPNGVNALDTLEPSPLTNAQEDSTNIISYDYNLKLQGLVTDIDCIYDTQSPVRIYPSEEDTVLQFNGTCPGKADVFTNGRTFTGMQSANSLAFWACKSPPGGTQEPSYFFYLRGYQNYTKAIGNITCTSSIRPAIYSVTYSSGIFDIDISGPSRPVVFGTFFPGLAEQAVHALGQLIADSQMRQTNLVSDSVTALGFKYFGLTTDEQQPGYLPLYERMIRGILQYEVAFTRLLYSTISDRPPTCSRTVVGSVTYTVVGLSVRLQNIGYLVPITIINFASLVVLLMAICGAKKGSYNYDITDPEVIALTEFGEGARDDSVLAKRLVYPSNVDVT